MSGDVPQSATERCAASPNSCDCDVGEIDLYLDVPQRFLHPLTSSLASMEFYGQTLRPKASKEEERLCFQKQDHPVLSSALSLQARNWFQWRSVAPPLHDQQRKARSTSRGHTTRTTLLRRACRRSQADTTVDRGETNAPLTPFAGSSLFPLFWIHVQPPQYQVIRSRPRCDPCRRGQADKWKARAIAMRDEAFLFLVVWQPGRRAMISTVVSPWDPCRKPKISISIVGELSIGKTVAGTGKQRQEGHEWQSSKKMLQHVLERNHATRRYEAANERTRLYRWPKP